MKTLADLQMLQKNFLQWLQGHEQKTLDLFVWSNHQFSANERVAIYATSISAVHARALQETYPICEQLVGNDFFKIMAADFLRAHPSRQPTLNEYGEELANFIASYPPARSLHYLADMAKLEWAWQKV